MHKSIQFLNKKGGVMADTDEHLWELSQNETEIAAMEQKNRMDQQTKVQDIISNMLRDKIEISIINNYENYKNDEI